MRQATVMRFPANEQGTHLRLLIALLLGLALLPCGAARADEPANEDPDAKLRRMLDEKDPEKQLMKLSGELMAPEYPVEKRRQAAQKLMRIGALLRATVRQLANALHDEDEQVRLGAAKALQEFGPAALDAMPDLIKALRDPSEDVRAEAAGALGGIWFPLARDFPVNKKAAVAALSDSLKDKSHKVRFIAASVVGWAGPSAELAVPGLIDALSEKDAKEGFGRSVSLAATESLGRIGPGAKAAIPALLELVKKDDNLDLRRHALSALGSIGDQDDKVVPTLLAAAEDEKLRCAVVSALGGMGPKRGKEAVPVLLKALDVSEIQDKDYAEQVQYFAVRSLGQMGPAAKVGVPKLEEIAKDPKTAPAVRAEAEKVLENLRR